MLKLGQKLVGKSWDECEKSEIVQILISHEAAKIYSIQFVYFSNGKISHSEIHGEPKGLNFDMVTFDYPSEFLTSVSGEIGENGLASIAFGTNKRKCGPFGGNIGEVRISSLSSLSSFASKCGPPVYKRFNYDFGRKSSFGGFHGTCYDGRVLGIGIYVKPIMSPLELKIEKV